MELVEPDEVLVKEERVEANMSRAHNADEDVRLIGDDGELHLDTNLRINFIDPLICPAPSFLHFLAHFAMSRWDCEHGS